VAAVVDAVKVSFFFSLLSDHFFAHFIPNYAIEKNRQEFDFGFLSSEPHCGNLRDRKTFSFIKIYFAFNRVIWVYK
jgi:hypothetical protein